MQQPTPSNFQILKLSPTLNSLWYKAKSKDRFLYIHYDDLTANKISSGICLNEQEFENLYNLYLKRKTQEKALARLAIKSRSINEMKLLLREIIYKLNNFNKHPNTPETTNQIIDDIITFLINKRYLDDLIYAESLIKRYQSGRKLKGPNYIKSLLIQKGISSSTIDKLMNSLYTDSNENDLINAGVLAKKYAKKRKYIHADSMAKKALLTRYLSAQGYSFDLISQVLKDS